MAIKQHFKLTSETHLGLIHYVTVQEDAAHRFGSSKPKGVTRLECSCEARSYSKSNICRHMISVRLGEAPLPAEKPEVDAVVGVIKGLDIIVLRDMHDMSVRAFLPPAYDAPDSSSIVYTPNPRTTLFETINKRGYASLGLFFDPLGANPNQQIKEGNYKYLLPYIDRAAQNIIEGTNLCRYGTIGMQDLANFIYKFIFNPPPEPDESRITATEIIRETTLDAFVGINEFREFQKAALEATKAADLPRRYLRCPEYREEVKELLIVTFERKYDGKKEEYRAHLETLDNRKLFGIFTDETERNIRVGHLSRAFFTGCYASIGQTIPEEVYCLPTHKLEEMYKMLTRARVVRTR